MGQLIYMVGASGSGKDSVMDAVKNRLNSNFPVIFAHRYITKPFALGGENYISLTESEFEMRQNAGLFAMSWQSHGYSYGIGVEINFWLEKGFFVVVNGSREYIPLASKLYSDMLVCLIKVSKEKLYERLSGRGRETKDEIHKRLERAESFQVIHRNLKIINNDGSLEESSNQFFNIVLEVFQPRVH